MATLPMNLIKIFLDEQDVITAILLASVWFTGRVVFKKLEQKNQTNFALHGPYGAKI